jgi:hypothetical protein
MFIGHIAVGLAAKRVYPKISLTNLFVAVLWLDLIWPIFLLLEIEIAYVAPGISKLMPLDLAHYPFSHSFIAAIFWSIIVAGINYIFTRDRVAFLILSLSVLSHWILDYFVHIPDLPLSINSESKFGLGLWNSVLGTLAIEGSIFIFGVLTFYFSKTFFISKKRSYWTFIIFLLFLYSFQFTGFVPPNMDVVAWGALGQWLFVIWAYWFEKNSLVVNH